MTIPSIGAATAVALIAARPYPIGGDGWKAVSVNRVTQIQLHALGEYCDIQPFVMLLPPDCHISHNWTTNVRETSVCNLCGELGIHGAPDRECRFAPPPPVVRMKRSSFAACFSWCCSNSRPRKPQTTTTVVDTI